VSNEAFVDGFEVYTNWSNFGPLVDVKCNTKQQQNLAKIVNKTANNTMPKAMVALNQARNCRLKTFQKLVKVRERKASTLSTVLLLNHHLKCYSRLATNSEKIT